MKKIMYFSFVTLCVLASCKSAPDSDEAKVSSPKEESEMKAAETYAADIKASRVEWIGTKVSGYHSGTVNIKSGQLNIAGDEVTAGNFVLDMTSIVVTGPASVPADASKKLTGHLHSAEFFEVDKFPEATFAITGVKPFNGTLNDPDDPRQEKLNEYKVANPTHTVNGNLTIKGITKNIEFPAAIVIKENTVEARAKFNIDRKQWNIEYTGKPDDLIRDEIHLGILLIANK